jgi:hypothetical protein
MTEARRGGRNGWTTVVHYFIGFVYGLWRFGHSLLYKPFMLFKYYVDKT